ncbi:MAG: hypothetical protein AAB583_00065, partial [Patescibacteria group bacterium]
PDGLGGSSPFVRTKFGGLPRIHALATRARRAREQVSVIWGSSPLPGASLLFNNLQMQTFKKVVFIVFISLFTIILLYYAALFVVHDFSPNFLQIDRCLDKGGAWDYKNSVCKLYTSDKGSE